MVPPFVPDLCRSWGFRNFETKERRLKFECVQFFFRRWNSGGGNVCGPNARLMRKLQIFILFWVVVDWKLLCGLLNEKNDDRKKEWFFFEVLEKSLQIVWKWKSILIFDSNSITFSNILSWLLFWEDQMLVLLNAISFIKFMAAYCSIWHQNYRDFENLTEWALVKCYFCSHVKV